MLVFQQNSSAVNSKYLFLLWKLSVIRKYVEEIWGIPQGPFRVSLKPSNMSQHLCHWNIKWALLTPGLLKMISLGLLFMFTYRWLAQGPKVIFSLGQVEKFLGVRPGNYELRPLDSLPFYERDSEVDSCKVHIDSWNKKPEPFSYKSFCARLFCLMSS